jgi:hypothetical protein
LDELSLVVLALFVSLAGAQEPELISFEIKDQFGRVHTDENGKLSHQTSGREVEEGMLESIVEKLKALMSRG